MFGTSSASIYNSFPAPCCQLKICPPAHVERGKQINSQLEYAPLLPVRYRRVRYRSHVDFLCRWRELQLMSHRGETVAKLATHFHLDLTMGFALDMGNFASSLTSMINIFFRTSTNVMSCQLAPGAKRPPSDKQARHHAKSCRAKERTSKPSIRKQ